MDADLGFTRSFTSTGGIFLSRRVVRPIKRNAETKRSDAAFCFGIRIISRKSQSGDIRLHDGYILSMVHGTIPNDKSADHGSHCVKFGGDMYGMDLFSLRKIG